MYQVLWYYVYEVGLRRRGWQDAPLRRKPVKSEYALVVEPSFRWNIRGILSEWAIRTPVLHGGDIHGSLELVAEVQVLCTIATMCKKQKSRHTPLVLWTMWFVYCIDFISLKHTIGIFRAPKQTITCNQGWQDRTTNRQQSLATTYSLPTILFC